MNDRPRADWLDWDGCRLRWAVDAAMQSPQMELCIDGIVFERSSSTVVQHLREFACTPSGNARIEFALRSGGIEIAPPWRVVWGRAAAPGAQQWQGMPSAMQPLAGAALPPIATPLPRAAVVVPIHNSPRLAQRCIEAVLRWTPRLAKLILIDDASTDAGVATLLADYAGRANVVIRSNAQNLGYTRSCNLGIELAGGADVVLLNSDTEVGPRWLERLCLTAYADAATGTVTAVSDNAGAFSVPELEQYCPIPSRWTLLQAQRALLQYAGGCRPELPTGNGFCMYVKRVLFDRIGMLDAQAFPAGYGEENDLCQRAEQAGFRHMIAGDVLVHHERSASFGDERRRALGAQGMAVLRARYPDYEAKIEATLFGFARRVLDYRVRRVYADSDGAYAEHAPRPRLLIVADPADSTASFADGLARFECYALVSTGSGWKLLRCADAAVLETASADEAVFCAWLVRYAIEAVYAADANPDLRSAAARVLVPCVDSVDAPLLENIAGEVARDGAAS